jgi:Ca2+-binding EF-hand superfamily protein
MPRDWNKTCAHEVTGGQTVIPRRTIVSSAALFAVSATLRTAIAQNPSPTEQQASKEKNLAIGEKEAKRMLLLMDKDKNGKVSKEEFMSFMEAEFDRLDTNKDGELDVKELTQSRVRLGGAIHR